MPHVYVRACVCCRLAAVSWHRYPRRAATLSCRSCRGHSQICHTALTDSERHPSPCCPQLPCPLPPLLRALRSCQQGCVVASGDNVFYALLIHIGCVVRRVLSCRVHAIDIATTRLYDGSSPSCHSTPAAAAPPPLATITTVGMGCSPMRSSPRLLR
jgi:hypothetical protein